MMRSRLVHSVSIVEGSPLIAPWNMEIISAATTRVEQIKPKQLEGWLRATQVRLTIKGPKNSAEIVWPVCTLSVFPTLEPMRLTVPVFVGDVLEVVFEQPLGGDTQFCLPQDNALVLSVLEENER